YYQKSKLYLLNCIEPRIEQLFNKKGHFYFDRRKEVYFYEITSKQIFLHYQTVLESYKAETNRSVPSWIKEGDELIYNAFIRGFFDADGYYHMQPENSDYRVRFGQAEYYILKDLKDLLEKEFECSDVLGPYQSKKNAKPYYELHIHGIKQLLKFHKIVRPCHPNKQLGGKKPKEECV
ncbi:MAG: LAGLIDADG family homing endonuclease, partial [Promethearchaeota archaeon]